VEFEWDPAKAAANQVKHRIDFRDAAKVFEGRFLTARSDRGGEPRWTAVGLLDGDEIAVVFTWRGERRRIISARKARRHERREYRTLFPG
jgi:uncharacterized protein